MPVEKRIIDAVVDFRCRWCGRFISVGEGKTLGYWSGGGGFFYFICPKCESLDQVKDALKDKKQERV